MANIKSINGNPIVLDSSGLESDAVATQKRIPRDLIESAGDINLSVLDWTFGSVQVNRDEPTFGTIINRTSAKYITTENKLYANEPVQIWCDEGWSMGLCPYASTDDSTFKHGQAGYEYAVLRWHQILYVPKGDYYRIVFTKDGTTDISLDASSHVHVITNSLTVDDYDNLAASLKWKLGEFSSFIPNWTRATHLLTVDIIEAKKPIKVECDDSVARPYIVYYDQNDNPINVKSTRATSIPKGARFRIDLNIMDGSEQAHYGMAKALKLTEMDGNFIWYGTSNGTLINYANNRIITCMPERNDYPVVVSLPDYSEYRIGAYLKGIWDIGSAFDYEPLYTRPIGIPAGQWYHIYLAKVGDGEFTDADIKEVEGLIKVTPIVGLGSAIDGVRYDLASLKRRVAELEGDVVPDYYESDTYSLNARISDILESNPTPNEKVVQFAFVTDFHANVYSQTFKTRSLLKKIFSETNCAMFVNGGDVANGKLSNGTAVSSIEFAKQMQRWSSWLIPDESRLSFMVVGNHDGGVDYNPDTSARIDEQTLFEMSALSLTAGNVTLDPNSKCAFYVDDDYRGIRWIVANVGNTSNIGKWSDTKSGVTGEARADAVSFVGDSLKSMQNGWTAIVINHILVNSWSSGPVKGAQYLEDVCDLYNAKSTASIDGRLFNFTDAKGEVACIIGGHLHMDYDYATAGGIPCIITTTDNRGGQCRVSETTNRLVFDTSGRDAGTPTEQAFDVFTINLENRTISTVRIGFGTDRSWTY